MIHRVLLLFCSILIISSFCSAQWEQLTNFSSGQVYCFASKGTTLYSGGYVYLAVSTDSGTTWNSASTGIAGYNPISAIAVGNSFMVAGMYGTSYRSTDNGANWIEGKVGLPSTSTWTLFGMNDYVVIHDTIYGVTEEGNTNEDVFRSVDSGKTWSAVGFGSYTAKKITALGGNLFVSTQDNGIYKGTYVGSPYNSWQWTHSFAGGWNVAIIGNILVTSGANGTYTSADTGTTWTKVSSKLISGPLIASGKNLFWCGYSGDSFASTDTGATWTDIGLVYGARSAYVFGNYLFAGTSSAMYRYALTGNLTGVHETEYFTPSTFYLKDNYPNPFNPSTNVDFSIPKASFVTLKVYDVLGREIATLVNENLQQGQHSVSVNLNSAQSGVYYYRLQSGNNVETKKMLLMK